MQSFIMMALEAYRFAIANGGFEKFQRSTSWLWPSQERIGVAPAQRFMGPGSDKITVTGAIFPHFRGGIGQFSLVRAQAEFGVPMLLVDGNGFYYGEWCIPSIDEEESIFLLDGTPRKIEFFCGTGRGGLRWPLKRSIQRMQRTEPVEVASRLSGW